jgi:hypothetical protein
VDVADDGTVLAADIGTNFWVIENGPAGPRVAYVGLDPAPVSR